MNRLEQAIPAGVIMALGLWVAFVSFTQQPAEAFVFPRLVSAVFVVLSVWVFVQSLMKDDKGFSSISGNTWRKILPGLVIAVIYVFWMGKALGFYTASAIAVFALISIYDSNSHKEVAVWIKRVAITAGFVVVMYLLFAMLLGVFTPRELLFR